MLTDGQVKLKETLKKLIIGRAAIPFTELEAKARDLATILFEDLSADQVERVIEELTFEHTVTIETGGAVVDSETFVEWLQDRKTSVTTPRWDAYEQLLVGRDWPGAVINSLAAQTDEVVELLGDPTRTGVWARRGLLMGEVQSGKTATYVGTLNKALDYGYKLVIVIGGHTNELRRQTQARMDSDLLGIDSEYLDDNIAHAKLPRTGIGVLNGSLRANVMTTVRGDFGSSKRSAGITWVESDLPTVFVIKKNARLIANVTNYIRQQAPSGVLDIPLIVVDDESDWGTPNTGADTDPTRVNKEIRRLLASSTRSSYLGITATPFANIFIDHEATDDEGAEDLFPRDYVRVMEAPSNYRGIGHYFAGAHSGLRTEVEDCLDLIPIRHTGNLTIPNLPPSLERAIATFVVGTAIRRLRNLRAVAASMMVNVSRFNNVQAQVHALVEEYVSRLAATIVSELARDASSTSDNADLIRTVWEQEFGHGAEFAWAEVRAELLDVAGELRVELVNSRTGSARAKARKLLTAEQRDREDERPTVFVGGDVLSRGLTLEGLQVSYFVREPRTMDTLMQMGRWFGYRPGFDDLARIWIPESTADDFEWAAEVTGELRDMLLEMRARNLTPRDFGLRVRTHPEGFAIVAANKSRSTEIVEGAVLWEGRLAEAWRVSSDVNVRGLNASAVRLLVEALTGDVQNGDAVADLSSGDYPSWRNVSVHRIHDFLRVFRGHREDPFWGASRNENEVPIARAIGDAKGAERWDVAVVHGSGEECELAPNLTVRTTTRNTLAVDGDLIRFGNRRVASPHSLLNALSSGDREAGDARANKIAWPSQSGVLEFIDRPILLIFAVATDGPTRPKIGKSVDIPIADPLITVAVAFPKLSPEDATRRAALAARYRVNSVWLRNSEGYVDDGDDVLDEDGDWP